jgi:DNA-nicking Smr family endonuclease
MPMVIVFWAAAFLADDSVPEEPQAHKSPTMATSTSPVPHLRIGADYVGDPAHPEYAFDGGPVKLTLDLHDIYNRGEDIERALREVIDEAVQKKASLVEIIPGKGSGQLKKRVLRFLDQKEIKALYHRVEKDSKNWGRLFVHFRWK